MNKGLALLLVVLLQGTVLFGQLSEQYMGAYVSDDFSTTVEFSRDDLQKNDFLVVLETTKATEDVLSIAGTGQVLENDEIVLLLNKVKYTGFLEIDDFGLINLTLNYPSEKNRTHFSFQSTADNYNESLLLEAQVFFSEKGAELDIFDNYGVLGFRILTSDNDPCGVQEISGFMNPTDDELSAFYFVDENGCEIEFLSTTKGIYIEQTNCHQAGKCENFTGMYFGVSE
ncbi:MAG: hypothetical protein V4638_11355 [Bacteroidota bacterium]